MDNKTNFHQN